MKLLPNWRAVLARAWSIRFILLAAVLSGLEAIFGFLDFADLSPRTVALIYFALTFSAFVARLIAQPSVSGERDAR